MLSDRFADEFRTEHRGVRDGLLALIGAFEARDRAGVRAWLGRVAALTGPHFRYEEEALYPALVGLFTPEYVEDLLGAHDRAIGAARTLVDLAARDRLSENDAALAVRLIRDVLPHVSDCDGLSIMVETLPEAAIARIFEARECARAANLDLLTWAATVRGRPVSPVAPRSEDRFAGTDGRRG